MIGYLIYDCGMLIVCFNLVQKIIFNKRLTADEKFVIRHDRCKFLSVAVFIMVIGLIWSIYCDLGFGEYNLIAHWVPLLGFYLLALRGLFIRRAYGPKDWKYVEKTNLGFIAAILFTIVIIGLSLTQIRFGNLFK